MSELNSQIKINIIESIKDQRETKECLDKLNNLLQDLKNNLKDSSNMKKSSIMEEKNKNDENVLQEDSDFITNDNNKEEIKEEENKEQEKDIEKTLSNNNVTDNNDKISNKNIMKMKRSGEYRNSNDFNYINYINNNKNEIEIPKEDSNINNINNPNEEHNDNFDQYFSDVNMSSIVQNNMNINSFNMTKNSELYITNILDNLDGKEDEKQVENNSSSAKIDTNEEIKLGLTNYQASNDKSNNHSEITNELNKALIRTHGITKSNIDSDDNEEDKEKSDNKSDYKSLPKKSNKNNNLINIINTKELDKKSAIDDLLKPEPKKDENEIIKEKKEKIKKDINIIYENQLKLVKINNKEKFSYITEYNNLDKDILGYESEFYLCNKNSINYLNRRNNFLNKKYFSYILTKEEKKKKNVKEKTKEDMDIIDNFVYNDEIIKKYKKKYNEKIETLKINLNYIKSLNNNEAAKEHKIYDIEDLTSLFYYFKLYSPTTKFRNNLETKSLNEMLKTFSAYRKILNEGNSFKRAFSYLLLETMILKNQIKKFDYIIYDIKKTMEKKYSGDIKTICNTLIDIKENSSIDYLMNSYNNKDINFDEIMINYIEFNIKKVIGVDTNKNKFLELDLNTLKILANIFEVNIVIYYIESEENYMKLNKYEMNNDNFNNMKKKVKASNFSDYDCSTTFSFLFFLNSYYIIYTEKSDIDSSIANTNNEKQYYYIDNLPSYKCPNCNKNTGLDIIPSYEAIFCHICLTKYLNDVLEKRVILFLKSNFSCIEYYTRPIKITSDIIINFSLYKYITNNYISHDFEKILEKSCFKCYEICDKNEIKKMKCLCQFCEKCVEKILKENLKDKNWLNNYELHNMNKTKCLCGGDLDLENLIKLGKNKPTENDKKMAEDRLLNIIKKKCCLCHENNMQKLFDFKILDGPVHFMCVKCHEKEIKNSISYETTKYNTKDDSNDIIIDNKKCSKRKFFCKICYVDHYMIEDNDIINKTNLIEKIEVKCKCCKDNCCIF